MFIQITKRMIIKKNLKDCLMCGAKSKLDYNFPELDGLTRSALMDDILKEWDVEFEQLVDNFEREPEINERREMRESLQP